MKDNRFKLTALVALALLAVGVGLGAAGHRFRSTPNTNSAPAIESSQWETYSLDIEGALSSMIHRWSHEDQLSADVRWQVRLFDQTLSGTGRYVQQGRGAHQRHGLEMATTSPQLPFSMRQTLLADDATLLTQWDTSLEQSASMIRLGEVDRRLQLTSSQSPGADQFVYAGLAHFLWRMRLAYQFDRAQKRNTGDRAMIVLHGKRRNDGQKQGDQLLHFLENDANAIAIYVDAKTGFPHRMVWGKRSGKQDNLEVEPQLLVDLFNVGYQSSDHSDLLKPTTGGVNSVDATEDYLLAILRDLGEDRIPQSGPNVRLASYARAGE